MKKTIIILLDFALIIFLLSIVIVFITGGINFKYGFFVLRMTSFRNIIFELLLVIILKLLLDPNWKVTKKETGISFKINKFFSFSKGKAS